MIETPKATFKPIVQYKQQPVYFFRFDCEETADETIRCNETTVMLKDATYESMVAALIEVKYSTDAQIALLYNYQNSPVEYADAMLEYQQWRVYCKEAARISFGIELTLNDVKERKIAELQAYDASDAVDSFTIYGQSMWLTVEERQQIATQISANEAVGRDNMTRWFGGHSFTFSLTTWKQMLVALEVYAGDAINVTEAHKAAIEALTTIEDMEAYDFTANYPTKLSF